jgi:hypothetical protein
MERRNLLIKLIKHFKVTIFAKKKHKMKHLFAQHHLKYLQKSINYEKKTNCKNDLVSHILTLTLELQKHVSFMNFELKIIAQTTN